MRLFFLLEKEERSPCFSLLLFMKLWVMSAHRTVAFLLNIVFLLPVKTLPDQELVAETLPWFSFSRPSLSPGRYRRFEAS